MSDYKQKLSGVLDGNSEQSLDTAIDEVIGDVNLQYRMRRYQIIGEAMRHELPEKIDLGFHQSVMAAIGQQTIDENLDRVETTIEKVKAGILSWVGLKPIAGLAIAASVALVTITLWQPVNSPTAVGGTQVASDDQLKVDKLTSQQLVRSAIPVSTGIGSSGMRWKVEKSNPQIQQKLNAYLVNHTEYSNSMQGLIPQARVAGFDNQ
jgi:sigma-E factor negative regulatory protein RseA